MKRTQPIAIGAETRRKCREFGMVARTGLGSVRILEARLYRGADRAAADVCFCVFPRDPVCSRARPAVLRAESS